MAQGSGHSLLRQAGPLMVGRGAAAVLSFALPLVLTRLLNVADYGTYKAAFLVITTGYHILQAGMAQSLYFFVPRPGADRAAFLTQSFASLIGFSSLGAVAMFVARAPLAHQFGNPALVECALPMALVCMTLVISTPLELHLTAVGRVGAAAVALFASEGVRVAASVVPLLLGWGLVGLLWGNAIHGLLRVLATAALVRLQGGPVLRWPLWREQFAHALPFGAAILVSMPQQTFHQWAVGARTTPAEFAIYMVGCFQIPIINLLYTPLSDVLQVRLAAPGGRARAVELFHEANLRLAAVFFPLCAGLVASGTLFIPALFTHRYDESVGIFRLAVLTVPFSALPLDATLRALGQTRYIFRNVAVKLLVTVPAVIGGLKLFGMIGAIGAHAAVEATMRSAMLLRARREMGVPLSQMLPWAPLGRLAAAALLACAPVLGIAQLASAKLHPAPWLALSGLSYAAVYAAVLALAPGEGGPVLRLKRALLGSGGGEVKALERAA
jgi:O-antigen/teichoic acid export membrane protein